MFKLAAEDTASAKFFVYRSQSLCPASSEMVLNSESEVSLIDFMHDPQQVAAYKQLQETVENLKKAHATLRKLWIASRHKSCSSCWCNTEIIDNRGAASVIEVVDCTLLHVIHVHMCTRMWMFIPISILTSGTLDPVDFLYKCMFLSSQPWLTSSVMHTMSSMPYGIMRCTTLHYYIYMGFESQSNWYWCQCIYQDWYSSSFCITNNRA